MRFHLPSVSSLAEFFGKSNTICINNHNFDYFLIVKNLTYLHFVKFIILFAFFLLTLCIENMSFRYKSSKAIKNPLFRVGDRRGDVCLAKIMVAA